MNLSVVDALAHDYISANAGMSLVARLGHGGSAAVYQVLTQEGPRAFKIYDPSFFEDENRAASLKRLDLQRQLIGRKCKSLIETFAVISIGTSFGILMEFLPWKELKAVLPQIPDNAIQPLIAQLIEAVEFLALEGLVHRDIKPENILINEDFTTLKLIDLGVIREMDGASQDVSLTDHGLRRPFIATAQYSSPEYLFRLKEPSSQLWKALTLYQVGAVVHDLITKRQIFEEEILSGNRYEVALAVLRKNPTFEGRRENIPIHLVIAARDALEKDIEIRLKLSSLKAFLPPENAPSIQLHNSLAKIKTRVVQGNSISQQPMKQKIDRELLVNSVEQYFSAQFMGSFSPTLRIEHFPHSSSGFSKIIHFPDGLISPLDMQVEFVWNSQEEANLSVVYRSATPKDLPFFPAILIGTLDSNTNADILSHKLFDHIVEILNQQTTDWQAQQIN